MFEMVERHTLDAWQLRTALMTALAVYGEVVEDPVDPFSFAAFLEFEGISDVWLRVSPEELDKRAKQLDLLFPFYASADTDSTVQFLASAATIVSHSGLSLDHSSTNAGQLNLILQKVRTDFAIICVTLLARSLGHRIPIRQIPRDQMLSALLSRDRPRLVDIFRHSLGVTAPTVGARHAASKPVPRAFVESRKRLLRMEDAAFERTDLTRERALELMSHPVMIDYASLAEARVLRRLLGPSFDAMVDISLERESPKPKSATKIARRLSSMSYANLRSAAQLECWSDFEILRLIDEHLNPALSPRFVYHSSTVSGDDWRRLYRRLESLGEWS
jgi:hypothetical protein